MRQILTGIFYIVILFVSTPQVLATHQEQVLGAAVNVAVEMPATVEGPGLLLPDSPLFFLDEIKQSVRVILAFTPENKAEVYSDVAGERLAELRFMLNKHSEKGIRIALDGISENLSAAADQVEEARMKGKDTKKLARSVNENIKAKQQTMDLLEMQSAGELKARVGAVQESLMAAKVAVEDSLPGEELESEIQYDLERMAAKKMENTAYSLTRLEADLSELEKMASDAASRSLSNREEAIKKAIESKNLALQREEERQLVLEKVKQTNLVKVSQDTVAATRETVKKAQEAAAQFKNYQEKVKQSRLGSTSKTQVAGAATVAPSR